MGSSTYGKTDKTYSVGGKGDLPSDRKFGGAYGPAPKAVGGKSDVQKPSTAKNQGQRPSWGTALLTRASKYATKPYTPGDYAAYRKAMTKKPVVAPVVKKPVVTAKPTTRGATAPTRATQPTRMAVNPRTGNTTGFTTGKTTGTSVSKSGVATKTYQSAGDRMKANAMNRTNQPAGPMGGGGGSRSSTSGGSSRTSGGGNLGGAAGRISEDRGSKR